MKLILILVFIFSISTAASASATTLKFAMLGDMNCNQDTKNLIDQIAKIPKLNGVITLGDYAYKSGTQECFKNITQPFTKLPFFKCLVGNHEVGPDAAPNTNPQFYYNYCSSGKPFWVKIIKTGEGVPISFIGLNTEIPLTKGSQQYNSINGYLKNVKDGNEITFLLSHRPCKGLSPNQNTIKPEWIANCNDLLTANNNFAKIDGFASGHIHCLAYNSHKAISGGGGASPRDSPFSTDSCKDSHWWYKLGTQGYLLVDIDTISKKIIYTFKDANSITLKQVAFS